MFTLREVETALLGGPESGLSIAITGVCTDSRSAGRGDLFFCIEGENFDGHEFAARQREMVLPPLLPQGSCLK